MSNGYDLWQDILVTGKEKTGRVIGDVVADATKAPSFLKQLAGMALPFAISAALGPLGGLLTKGAGATSGIASNVLNFLGKGLSLDKAKGVKSLLHGLLTKLPAQMLLGKGGRKLLSGDKKDIKRESLSKLTPLQAIYAMRALTDVEKDFSEGQRALEQNYMLGDVMTSVQSMIDPKDIFKILGNWNKEGHTFLDELAKAQTGPKSSMNPVTGAKWKTLQNVKEEASNSIKGAPTSIATRLTQPTQNVFTPTTPSRISVLQRLASNEPSPFIPKYDPVTYVQNLFSEPKAN
tara:strand:+ start:2181 stop:3053 length:873 start_codon:yes stop_codon:yes gene_type:complete